MIKLTKEATATFQYEVDGRQETVTVGSKFGHAKNELEWKNELYDDAIKHLELKVGIKEGAVSICLVEFETK